MAVYLSKMAATIVGTSVTFDVTTMMAGKNQAALDVCAQTKVIFPFKDEKVAK